MHLSNEQLVEKILSVDIDSNTLVAYLNVASMLLKNHGKIIYTKIYSTTIKKIDPNVWDVISLLKNFKKDTPEDIKHIIRYIKEKADDYHPEFVVKTDSEEHYDKIKAFLDKTFDHSEITKHTSRGNSIRISGEGWYYKRGLDQDIKKILNL